MDCPPVILLAFRRPELTRRVMDEIRKARPTRLFVIADGPRPGVHGEKQRCDDVRRAVDQGVTWPCEVGRRYRETNLGCARSVSEGITWAMEQVEEAIVLEDDTLPDETFFRYCADLLSRFQDDERVMCVSGDCFQEGRLRDLDASYYFSIFNHCWGWATWRESWKKYDHEMNLWKELRSTDWLLDVVGGVKRRERYWRKIFDAVAQGRIDSWAYRWTFACWVHSGLTALPRVNLVRNVGYGDDATHTTRGENPARSAGALAFPLKHPQTVFRLSSADDWSFDHYFLGPSTVEKLARRVSKLFHLRRSSLPGSRNSREGREPDVQ